MQLSNTIHNTHAQIGHFIEWDAIMRSTHSVRGAGSTANAWRCLFSVNVYSDIIIIIHLLLCLYHENENYFGVRILHAPNLQ